MFRNSRYFSNKEGKHNLFGAWEESIEELQQLDEDTSEYKIENLENENEDS